MSINKMEPTKLPKYSMAALIMMYTREEGRKIFVDNQKKNREEMMHKRKKSEVIKKKQK